MKLTTGVKSDVKKILVLTTTYPRWRGDTEPAFVHNLGIELASDYEVHVLAPYARGTRKYEVMDKVIVHRFFYLPVSLDLLCYDGGIVPKLKSCPWFLWQVPFLFFSMLLHGLVLVKKEKISLIHAHWVIPQGYIGLLIRFFSGAPVKLMVTSHGADLYALNNPWLQRLKAYIFRKADVVTVVSKAMRDFCRDNLKIERPISVCAMGVDCRHRFRPLVEFGQRKGIVFVGRLVEKKGVRYLLEAFNRFQQEYPGETLTIIGDGVEKNALQALARQYGIEEKVNFIGAVDADGVARYFNCSRVAVMPSIVAGGGDQEGLGLVAAEALACGCITIVANIPAIQDVHNDPDLQFLSADVDSLYDCLSAIYENPERALKKALLLREHVIANYDWLNVGKNYKQLIANVISE